MTGFILLNKDTDITSFSACNRVKRILGAKKTGHTGTLDPMATGVLCVAVGNATRFIELLPSHGKSYRAEARLGVTTDTLDVTGKVLSRSEVNINEEQLLAVCESFRGRIMQTPPMYSAVSKDGVRLYELARQGLEVDREEREIEIYSLNVSDFDGTEFTLEVSCSAGTYIRTLIDDIGRKLGCGAVMTALVRTGANGFSLDDCHTLAEIEEYANNGKADELIVPVEKCFDCYSPVTVSEAQAKRFSNGGELSLDRIKFSFTDGFYRVLSPAGEFLGLGEAVLDENLLKVRRVYID